jgi:CAAX protease family protein
MPAWIKKHPLVAYFVLAFAISWAFELPLVAVKQGWIQLPIPFALHYLAAFGPMLAALCVTAISQGRGGLRRLLGGLLEWNVGFRWILFSFLSPIALFVVAAVARYVVSGDWPDLSLLGQVDYLPNLGVAGAVLLWLLTFGLGEEIGWRGFALPRLQQGHNALAASLILSLPWAFWHLPAFFYKATYMSMGLAAGFPMLLISLMAAAIIFTWLYNSTRGSLVPVVVFHALFDLLSASSAGGSSAAAIMSAVPMIWAVLVVILYKPTNLSRSEKQQVQGVVTEFNQAPHPAKAIQKMI